MLASGVNKLPKLSDICIGSFIMFWHSSTPADVCYHQASDNAEIHIVRDLSFEAWNQIRLVQFHLYSVEEVSRAQEEDPNIA